MSYTIFYNFGGNVANNFLIQDSTADTTHTSVKLPGRNYAGYGNVIDQDLVDLTQNFARFSSGPSNPITGQVWYDSANVKIKLNTSSNATPSWKTVAISDANTAVIFGSVTTANITTGSASNAGAITGNWTFTSGSRVNGSIANLTNITTSNITTGANTTAGSITGNWTLTSGSRLNATYADLAERFEADTAYDYGTVLELGGSKEVTIATQELSENIFGVVSDTAGYLMNSAAGSDETHPPIAMTGRVAVKVVGVVKKGDRLVSAGNGFARSAKSGEATPFNTIGRALEDKLSDGEGKVLSAVSAKL